jgi:hypothetical protein
MWGRSSILFEKSGERVVKYHHMHYTGENLRREDSLAAAAARATIWSQAQKKKTHPPCELFGRVCKREI